MHLRVRGFALGACLLACQGPEVNHVGSYVFLPNAPVSDTDPLPLEHFLVIEQDGLSGESLFYYFEGRLGAAGIGLSSLERIRAYYGQFRLRFEYPLARYTSPPAQAGTAGETGVDGSGVPAGAGGQGGASGSGWYAALDPAVLARALELRVGQHSVPLVALDSETLSQVGATRFLSTLSSGQWSISAYFGVLPFTDPLGSIELSSEDGVLRYEPSLEPPSVFESVLLEVPALELLHEPTDRARVHDAPNRRLRRGTQPHQHAELARRGLAAAHRRAQHPGLLRRLRVMGSGRPRAGEHACHALDHQEYDCAADQPNQTVEQRGHERVQHAAEGRDASEALLRTVDHALERRNAVGQNTASHEEHGDGAGHR